MLGWSSRDRGLGLDYVRFRFLKMVWVWFQRESNGGGEEGWVILTFFMILRFIIG